MQKYSAEETQQKTVSIQLKQWNVFNATICMFLMLQYAFAFSSNVFLQPTVFPQLLLSYALCLITKSYLAHPGRHEPPGHPDADAHAPLQGPEELLHRRVGEVEEIL